jgi:PAS domain S-box-containing protein
MAVRKQSEKEEVEARTGGNPLHILLVDDNPDDRILVLRELKRTFEHLVIEEVTGEKSFLKALESDPELVITDYQLRWTDGLEVLRRIKSRWPDCPVVMFTGTGSEEIAVEAMKAGVDDYVLKSPRHFSRVSAAAKLVVQVARQQKHLKEAETRYTRLFDGIPVGLFRATQDGVLLDANPALAEMLGYQAGELRGRTAADCFAHLQEYQRWRELLERKGMVQHFEVQLRRADGSICWVESNSTLDKDESAGQVVIEGSLEDISARKLAEEEREHLIIELQNALSHIKTLSGLLPICSSCKKIRDDTGFWNQIEFYIQQHSDAEFTHSFCPDCVKRLYPEFLEQKVPASHSR